jgi:hypothetical protein
VSKTFFVKTDARQASGRRIQIPTGIKGNNQKHLRSRYSLQAGNLIAFAKTENVDLQRYSPDALTGNGQLLEVFLAVRFFVQGSPIRMDCEAPLLNEHPHILFRRHRRNDFRALGKFITEFRHKPAPHF